MTIKVLSYSITAAINYNTRDGVLTKEKTEYIEWALRKFDENATLPTDEEIAYWRDYWGKYRKSLSKKSKKTKGEN